MALRPADAAFLEAMEQRLPGVLSAPEPRYLEEPRGHFKGRAAALARPSQTVEVSEILRMAQEARVGVIPYGGGTGLVGGQISEAPGHLLLSLERMNEIGEARRDDLSIEVGAGAVLADIHAAAERAGLMFPLSLASEGTCRIGGNLATNAGGVNVLRWGNARDLCLSVEAVLAGGTVIGGLKSLKKDNTGYDLRHLLIGSEGTLGVITRARLKLVPKPAETVTALLDVASPDAALTLLGRMREVFGEQVSAFELISAVGVSFLRETLADLPLPPVGPGAWKVLIELGAGPGAGLLERFEGELEAAFDTGAVQDGHLAQSLAQAQAIWTMRESIPEANRRIGAISSHDVSVPVGDIPRFIEEARAAVAKLDAGFRVNCFGHLGDGNLHFNVFPPVGRGKAEFANRRGEVSAAVHDLVHAFGGSFSAEHGVGRLKVEDLTRYGDAGKRAAIEAIKAALDPAGILNPGVIVPGH